MKKFNYSQAQKRIALITSLVILASAILQLVEDVISLLSVALNYHEFQSYAKLSQVGYAISA